MKMNKNQRRAAVILLAPFTVLFLMFTVLPIISSIALSFTYFNTVISVPICISLGLRNVCRFLIGGNDFECVRAVFLQKSVCLHIVFHSAPPYLPAALATVRVRLTAVVVACTTDIIFTLTLESSPNCCAIRGTSFAASIMPSPNSILSGKVISPKNNSVVCKKAVKHSAAICFIH